MTMERWLSVGSLSSVACDPFLNCALAGEATDCGGNEQTDPVDKTID